MSRSGGGISLIPFLLICFFIYNMFDSDEETTTVKEPSSMQELKDDLQELKEDGIQVMKDFVDMVELGDKEKEELQQIVTDVMEATDEDLEKEKETETIESDEEEEEKEGRPL